MNQSHIIALSAFMLSTGIGACDNESSMHIENHTGKQLFGAMYYVSSKGAQLYRDPAYSHVSGVQELQEAAYGVDNLLLRPRFAVVGRHFFVFSPNKTDLKEQLATQELEKLYSVGVGITSFGRIQNSIIIRTQNGTFSAELRFGTNS